jgi:hypothetical protein
LGYVVAPPEKANLTGHEFVALPPRASKFPDLKASFDIDLATLAEIVSAAVGELPYTTNPMPFGAFLPFAGAAVREHGGGSNREIRDLLSGGQSP